MFNEMACVQFINLFHLIEKLSNIDVNQIHKISM